MAERRLELGFEGGTVLRLSVPEQEIAALTEALTDGGGGRWQRVSAEEGVHYVNAAELVYVRLAPQVPGRVGFGGS
jgi:hypothetical protein